MRSLMNGFFGRSSWRWRLGRASFGALGLVALVSAAPPARAQDISDEARKHFRAGVNYLQDPDGERIEEAYIEFKRAYEISKSPKILGNIALCAMRLERDGEALEAYTRYLSGANDIKADDREQIERDLQTLTASAVRLSITSDAKEATVVDARYPNQGAPVTNRYVLRDGKAEIIVRAGHHVVRLQTDGVDRGQWQFDALGGTSQSRNFPLTAVAEARSVAPSRSAPVLPWVLLGVGGAALTGGAVTGVLALRGVNDLEDRCPNNECPSDSDYESRKRSTKTFAVATDVLLLSGGVAAAVGAGWLLFGSGSKTATKDASYGNVVGSAACTPAGCAAFLKARF
jgi:hypothetical protein